MLVSEKQLTAEQSRRVATLVREELARRRISRQHLADEVSRSPQLLLRHALGVEVSVLGSNSDRLSQGVARLEIDRDHDDPCLKSDVPLAHVHQGPFAKVLHPHQDEIGSVRLQQSVDFTWFGHQIRAEERSDARNPILVDELDSRPREGVLDYDLGFPCEHGFSDRDDHCALR